jgi:DNA anti-recombination protein RmuC
VDTIDNLDVAGIEITDLFKSILTLSRKAVENSNVDRVRTLSETNSSLEENVRVLKGRNNHLENELLKEKERADKLQDDFDKLVNDIGSVWKEIDNFERLTGKQKLKQINSHSNRMKYIVGQFGNVDVVEDVAN